MQSRADTGSKQSIKCGCLLIEIFRYLGISVKNCKLILCLVYDYNIRNLGHIRKIKLNVTQRNTKNIYNLKRE